MIALAAVCEALRDRLPLTLEQAEKIFADYDVVPLQRNGATVGALMIKGPEIHVAVIPPYRGKWLSRKLIRETFAPIFERYGYAVTSVMADNIQGQAFVERLGFKREQQDTVIHYRLKAHASPHIRCN